MKNLNKSASNEKKEPSVFKIKTSPHNIFSIISDLEK